MRFSLRTLLILTIPLLLPPAFGQEKGDAGEALYGEWEIVELVKGGKVQDFGRKPGGWFVFEPGGFLWLFNARDREWLERDKRARKLAMQRCATRRGEIDIWIKTAGRKEEMLLKARYDLQGGRMRVIWNNDYGERPTDFTAAVTNRRLNLFVLKKLVKSL